MANQQFCPICQGPVEPNPRYPRYVCAACATEAVSADGHRLRFFNESLSGGFYAEDAATGTRYDSHECFIRGQRCRADEARFGGIVIQVEENAEEKETGRYPEPKRRELTEAEKRRIREQLEAGEADIYKLSDKYNCRSSQVAGIKAAMTRTRPP